MTNPVPTPRQVADGYVDRLCELDPTLATVLGRTPPADGLPDLSPSGLEAGARLQRATLAELDHALTGASGLDLVEQRCARLLRERLTAALALHEAGEGLRSLNNLFCPLHQVREAFQLMPTATTQDWEVVARRLARVPAAYRGYCTTLTEGARQGLFAGPLQVATVVEQLTEWSAGPYFASLAASGPAELRDELDRTAAAADEAVVAVRDFLRDTYGPQAEGTPDVVGRERYARFARFWNGTDLGGGTGLEDAYGFGWAEFQRIRSEQRAAAEQVLPGSSPRQAMDWLDEHGEAVEGVEQIRLRLQQMMDEAMDALDGTHVDLAPPIRRVEAMIAPPGSAAAPYYTEPSQDFSRPGRTWLPTLGRTRFPLWNLVSTWYHEGVPGHHLQLAQWTSLAGSLSTFQTAVGAVGADVEGWALYAERLMDELGFLTDPGARLGYLEGQQLRAVRVVIDIGMHLGLPVPEQADGVLAGHRGEPWTPELGRAFLGEHCGGDAEYLDSELVRYLGMPGQAISYKLGERAWLAGREAARAAHGEAFDLKAWHMAALSQGSLGLDDLVEALAAL